MRSIVYHPQLVAVYHQTAGRYTLARDEIQPRRGWWYTPRFARRWYAKPAAWINKKRTFGRQKFSFCWWGMVDSDHRSQWQQIYSLPPLAAREIPHILGHVLWPLELVIGVEPTTCWLQISCSAIEPHQRIVLVRTVFAIATGILYHKSFGLSTPFRKIFWISFLFFSNILVAWHKNKNVV